MDNAARRRRTRGGAAALAALTSGEYVPAPQERVGVLICGGNTAIAFKSR
jgi:threonine dehydratase